MSLTRVADAPMVECWTAGAEPVDVVQAFSFSPTIEKPREANNEIGLRGYVGMKVRDG